MKKMYLLLTIACFIITAWAAQGFTAEPTDAQYIYVNQAESVFLGTTKTGNPYARIIAKENQAFSGFQFPVDRTIMAFGSTYDGAKAVKKGEKFAVICTKNEYRGKINYQALGFVSAKDAIAKATAAGVTEQDGMLLWKLTP